MSTKKSPKDSEPALPLAGYQPSPSEPRQIAPAQAKEDIGKIANSTRELREKASFFPSYNLKDDFELFIPIHGFARFTREEMAIINHPAFQRLGEIYQLGQAHLVFRGATHKRMEHVLGTVCVVQEMIEAVRDNYNKLQRHDDDDLRRGLCKPLSEVECIFTRLAALLHDIGHLPVGHTLEDELKLFGKYGKHDCVKRLSLILDKEDWVGEKIEPLRKIIDEQYARSLLEVFSDCKITASDLLLHIIAKDRHNIGKLAKDIDLEKSGEPIESSSFKDIPSDFRISVCRDMVGNTVCADLLDYLYRDWHHAGKQRHFDKRLFQYMQIRCAPVEPPLVNEARNEELFVISVGKSPKKRTDAISQILILLQDRYGLAETILFHKTKCSAAAMLERALMELLSNHQKSGSADNLIDSYENKFLDYSDLGVLKTLLHDSTDQHCAIAGKILRLLIRRRLYKSLYTTFLSDLPKSKATEIQHQFEKSKDASKLRFEAVKRFEVEWNLPEGSVVMYCPTKEMNAKIAKVRIHVRHEGRDVIDTLDKLDTADHEIVGEHPLAGKYLDVQIGRFLELWRVHVFLSREVFEEKSETFLKHLREAVGLFLFGIHSKSKESYADAVLSFARETSMIEDSPYYGRTLLTDQVLAARRIGQTTEKYPLGVPSIISYYA